MAESHNDHTYRLNSIPNGHIRLTQENPQHTSRKHTGPYDLWPDAVNPPRALSICSALAWFSRTASWQPTCLHNEDHTAIYSTMGLNDAVCVASARCLEDDKRKYRGDSVRVRARGSYAALPTERDHQNVCVWAPSCVWRVKFSADEAPTGGNRRSLAPPVIKWPSTRVGCRFACARELIPLRLDIYI